MPRSSIRLTTDRLRALARNGADITLKRLRAEIIAIERAFPSWPYLRVGERFGRTLRSATTCTRKMSAAARKAVSVRMKRYWAERRKAQAKVK